MVSFYPSISPKLYKDAIDRAGSFTEIINSQMNTSVHSRKSFLFSNQDRCVKKTGPNFDETIMDCLDGAESCELVGLFILHKLQPIIKTKTHRGLYRDDGLAVLNLPGPQLDRVRKDIIRFFKEVGLRVTIETNLNCIDILDIHFNLAEESYKPYRKENSETSYMNYFKTILSSNYL